MSDRPARSRSRCATATRRGCSAPAAAMSSKRAERDMAGNRRRASARRSSLHAKPLAPSAPVAGIALDITTLAAGGDGLGRDAEGRVTFVPYTAPGDRIRARLVAERAAWARGELVEGVVPSPGRVAPPCPLFVARACGGCQWQHVERAAQLAAKHALVAGALRHAIARGLELQPILDAAPAYGWRRRARLHARDGGLGFFAPRSHAIADQRGVGCVQLEPRLRDAVAAVRTAGPPDGEVDIALGEGGAVVVATRAPWPAGAALVGSAGIVGVETGDAAYGAIEI